MAVENSWDFLGIHRITTHPGNYLGHDLESYVGLGRLSFGLSGCRGLPQNLTELESFKNPLPDLIFDHCLRYYLCGWAFCLNICSTFVPSTLGGQERCQFNRSFPLILGN